MQLVKDVIKNKYGSVPKASFAINQYTTLLYRWSREGAMLGDCGNVYRRVKDAMAINEKGEHIRQAVYVKSGRFMGKSKDKS